MTTYRVHFKDTTATFPPRTPILVECDEVDVSPERADFYLDDELVACIAGAEFSHLVIEDKAVDQADESFTFGDCC